MKVIVNRTEVELFSGARVADAVRAYYVRAKKRIPEPLPHVEDPYGNSVTSDGALSEGNRLIIKKNKTRQI